MRYEQYSLLEDAKRVYHYIDGMTDRAYDYLPFWLIEPVKKPAEAEHCRVDDAELVGSWYEATDSLRKIIGEEEELMKLRAGFRRKVLSSWGEHGLRFHEPYPWTHTMHSSFHEMGYILPALNRMVKDDPNDAEAEKRASELVRGLRSLVIERKLRTFWSGDSPSRFETYEFPNDVYLQDGGFDLTRYTGRGEQPIRNAVILHALVDRYVITGDEVALDLAKGLSNHLLTVSRYFNYKFEYFGHVHSSMWIAAGLLYLGRVTGEERYSNAGKKIYDYTRSMTSEFGWLPEYAQWHPLSEEHCETCCIKDMIMCHEELILAGYDEYWDEMNKFARNQLTENQIKYTGYMVVDNTKDDADGKTYRDLDKRLIGGYTGGAEPNSISLNRFRSIAGCCVGTAPIALEIIWRHVVTMVGKVLTVNIHTEKETEAYSLTHRMPDDGSITLTLKKDTPAAGFRLYDWMGKDWVVRLNGEVVAVKNAKGIVFAENLKAGDVLTLEFPLETVEKKENFAGAEYTEYWRGADVVDLLPRGEHVRLYQRDKMLPKYYPTPKDVAHLGVTDRGPTQAANDPSVKKLATQRV